MLTDSWSATLSISALLPALLVAPSCTDDTETGTTSTSAVGGATSSTTAGGSGQGGSGQGGSGQGGSGQGGSGQGGSESATPVQISAGNDHTCLRLSNGGVLCWGRNGVIGDGSGSGNDPVSSPHAVVGVADATGLATGDDHSCVHNDQGEATCWGWGLIGDGTDDYVHPLPTSLALAGVVVIDVGGGHKCASTTSAVYCWGSNSRGETAQPGNPNQTESPELVTDGNTPIAAADELALGENFSCARRGGTVLCWGENTRYQLGLSIGYSESPTPIEPLSTSGASAIAAGSDHACVIIGTGLTCWGDNRRGQLAITPIQLSLPIALPNPTGVSAVTLGDDHSCALLTDGTVECWGDNTRGQLGTGATSPDPVPVPAKVSGLSGVVAISAGWDHTCAITGDDAVWCWGRNNYGQLGDGTTNDAASPQPVAY